MQQKDKWEGIVVALICIYSAIKEKKQRIYSECLSSISIP